MPIEYTIREPVEDGTVTRVPKLDPEGTQKLLCLIIIIYGIAGIVVTLSL